MTFRRLTAVDCSGWEPGWYFRRERGGRSVGEMRRRLRWVYLTKREKSLSPKTQKMMMTMQFGR